MRWPPTRAHPAVTQGTWLWVGRCYFECTTLCNTLVQTTNSLRTRVLSQAGAHAREAACTAQFCGLPPCKHISTHHTLDACRTLAQTGCHTTTRLISVQTEGEKVDGLCWSRNQSQACPCPLPELLELATQHAAATPHAAVKHGAQLIPQPTLVKTAPTLPLLPPLLRHHCYPTWDC